MALVQDILLADDWDLLFANGDFIVGASDLQHLALITEMDIGHLKESPFLGVGVRQYLGGNTPVNEIKTKAQQMYEADNYTINLINVKDGEIINVVADRL
jgi:hypothetical protein